MSKSQRTKGAVFEREIAALLSSWFNLEIKRNITQARDGGNDLNVGKLVIECKRRASLKGLRAWLHQATAATQPGQTPIVIMREDGATAPMVLLNLGDFLALTTREKLGL